jgi:hypothetical protein
VRVPPEAAIGKARVTLSFDDWTEGKVSGATVEVPVVDAGPNR